MKTLLIASSNPGKVSIYTEALKAFNIKTICLLDLPKLEEPEENGKDEIENAEIKARYYYEKTGYCVMANDTGVRIDGIPEEFQPNQFVRRDPITKKELTDDEMIDRYSKLFLNIGGKTTGNVIVGIAVINEKGELASKLFKPKRYYQSVPSEVRVPRFPLSSLAYDPSTGRYMSEMTPLERNELEGKEFLDQIDFIINSL